MSKPPKPATEYRPLGNLPGQAIYDAFNACRDGSWFDQCEAFERALIEAGWTPPANLPESLRQRRTA